MALVPGTRLGNYEILGPLGAGGMGEVYRARDARLARDAAIKALPEEFARDPDRRERFDREARVLAALHHPNIAAIYGVETSGGASYLALEYVAGESLADRIRRGPIPVRDAIEIAIQLATGMEAAHEAGIVHRDLKPGNVMVTGDDRVKILDFGLAKAPPAESAAREARADSPTLTHSPTTIPGVILGTAAYLAPEQARGKPVDRRADIWAFGCILYECLVGRPVFQGETVADLIAAIVERQPEWSALPPSTPPRVRALLERCLRKDARERMRDIGDARLELSDARAGREAPAGASAGGPPAGEFRRGPGAPALWIGAALAAVIGTLLVLAGARVFGPRGAGQEIRRLTIPAPGLLASFNSPVRLSPDGRYLLYPSGDHFAVRDLTQYKPFDIPGTEGAMSAFWSPDGRRIAYVKERALWTSDLAGANASVVTTGIRDLDINEGEWGPDDNLVVARYLGGLYVASASGGEARLLVAPDSTEVDFHHPQFLPDGRHILAVAHRKSGPHAVVVISYPSGGRKNLGEYEDLKAARYSPTGHLLLSIEDGRQEILAVSFSATRLAITGPPVVVAPGGLFPTVSSDGSLAYVLSTKRAPRELVWVDRTGRVERVPGAPQAGLDNPAISPDGRQVAIVSCESGNADIWILDPARGTRRRLVATPHEDFMPAWSADGKTIFYLDRDGFVPSIMSIPADGHAGARHIADGWSLAVAPGGRTLLFGRETEKRETLYRIELADGARPVRLTAGAAQEQSPALSPDGSWLAYASDEAGNFEIFVRRYPNGTDKRQVSLKGGAGPTWSRDGRSLFFWDHDVLMEAPVSGTKGSMEFGPPRALFSGRDIGVETETVVFASAFAAAPDGRFLMTRRVADDPMNGILFVQNWRRILSTASAR